ncbi:MAG: hypothetical protein HC905_17005 [Bacteroidales bacterium]|nr:hypothetical protein [Bacteroidales bacterium]
MMLLEALLISIVVTIIGAIPFGLVNLTVLDISYRAGKPSALKIAHGATLVEIVFGITAVLAGSAIGKMFQDNVLVESLILIIPVAVALIFFFKRNPAHQNRASAKRGFLNGALLNLVSFQVFLYWLFAMTYISTHWLPEIKISYLLVFATGIWVGKMGVLYMYAYFSNTIFSRFGFIAKNVNRIIGCAILLSVLIQIIK